MTQNDFDFSLLLHQSQQLAAKVSGNRNIPSIYRGLEQLEVFSSKLASKAGIYNETVNDIKHAELAKINFMHSGLEAQVNAVGTDVAGYLQAEYEKKIIASIEKIQKETNKKINEMINSKLSAEWERRKNVLLEEGQFEGGNTVSTSGSLAGPSMSLNQAEKLSMVNIYSGPKFTAYVNVVKKLNEARLKGTKLPLAKTFAAELKGLDRELRSEQVLACWDALSILGREDEHFEQANVSSLYRSPAGSPNRSQWNKALISGSKKYLETSFSKYIDNTISSFPRDTLLGGKPSNVDRIKTFLHIRIKRGSPMDIQKMDLIDGTPIWACIFYLFRCGYLREAYQFACQYEFHLLKSEPNFIAFLKAFIETEDNFLTGTLKAQIQSDYSQRLIIGNQDPFKMTLFKILGRCDLSRKTVPEVITTTQDYIWLQLWLIKDAHDPNTGALGSSPSASQYNLASLQKLVLDFGPKHFNPKGNNPLQYFETLLTVGLFEDAIAYLFDTPHQLDAIHFAIVLFYHGTINGIPNPGSVEWETLVSLKEPGINQSTVKCLNFYKLISSIAKTFSSADVIDALQYYLILPLAPHGYAKVCQDGIRDIILSSGSISALLGDTAADGTKRPGIISKFAPLMATSMNNSEDQRRFIHSLTQSAAAKCEKDDKYLDAIHLYNLCYEYDKVLQIVCRKMSQIFSLAYVSSTHLTIYSTAKSVYQFYTSSQEVTLKVQPRSLETCKTLLGLLEFKKLTAESQWRPALQRIEELGLLGLAGTDELNGLNLISSTVEAFKSLDDTITSNISEILLLSMTSIYQIFLENKQYVSCDPGRQIEITKLRRKSRNLMILVGMLQYRVSQEVCAKMTRMDIFMN